MIRLLVVVFLFTLGLAGAFVVPLASAAPQQVPAKNILSEPAVRAYVRQVRNHIGENFRNKGYHNQMMFLRAGGATALFNIQADGRVSDLRFVNVTPKGGANVAYFARQSILEASRRFRPFSPELRRVVSALRIHFDFGNVGLRSARHANPDF